MSRYTEWDGDEPFPNAAEMWQANLYRALKGKRGRKALVEMREALLNLPEKRLIKGALCTVNPAMRAAAESNNDWWMTDFNQMITDQGEGVCAIGAYTWWKKVKAGADPAAAFDSLPGIYDIDDDSDALMHTAYVASELGMARILAWDLAYRNDEIYDDCTPEERYVKYLEWVEGELAKDQVEEPQRT